MILFAVYTKYDGRDCGLRKIVKWIYYCLLDILTFPHILYITEDSNMLLCRNCFILGISCVLRRFPQKVIFL